MDKLILLLTENKFPKSLKITIYIIFSLTLIFDIFLIIFELLGKKYVIINTIGILLYFNVGLATLSLVAYIQAGREKSFFGRCCSHTFLCCLQYIPHASRARPFPRSVLPPIFLYDYRERGCSAVHGNRKRPRGLHRTPCRFRHAPRHVPWHTARYTGLACIRNPYGSPLDGGANHTRADRIQSTLQGRIRG